MERTPAQVARTAPINSIFVAGPPTGASVDEQANNSFSEESDDSSDREAETEEQFWGQMMGRSAALSTGEEQLEAASGKEGDKSIIELSREEEEEDERARGGSGPGTPHTNPTHI